jgi:hypothetical protein
MARGRGTLVSKEETRVRPFRNRPLDYRVSVVPAESEPDAGTVERILSWLAARS